MSKEHIDSHYIFTLPFSFFFFWMYCVCTDKDYFLSYILSSGNWHILWSYDHLLLFKAHLFFFQGCTRIAKTVWTLLMRCFLAEGNQSSGWLWFIHYIWKMFPLAAPARKRLTEAELSVRGKFLNSLAFWRACRLITILRCWAGSTARPCSTQIRGDFTPCELNIKESSNKS